MRVGFAIVKKSKQESVEQVANQGRRHLGLQGLTLMTLLRLLTIVRRCS